jgi:HEAT repeat protein
MGNGSQTIAARAKLLARRCVKILCFLTLLLCLTFSVSAQDSQTTLQLEIERQTARLKSGDIEVRRDAAHQLRILENALSSKAADAALKDSADIVKATAAEAVVYKTSEDAVRDLLPLLSEKSEFVRREAAFALGQTYDKSATPRLIQILQTDKLPSVRAAAAIALGEIADERAIESLGQILLMPKTKKNRRVVDDFVQRSAARSLGKIRFKRAVPFLITALRDTTNVDDVRRESAFALGLIADVSATEVLQAQLGAPDYLLAQTASDALERIRNSQIVNP